MEEAAHPRTARHCDSEAERMASPMGALVIDDDIPVDQANVSGDESGGGDVGEMWL